MYPQKGNVLPFNLKMTSTNPVEVVFFSLNAHNNGGEAASIYPSAVLGTSSVVGTWQYDYSYNDCFEIVASQHGTALTIKTVAQATIMGVDKPAGIYTYLGCSGEQEYCSLGRHGPMCIFPAKKYQLARA